MSFTASPGFSTPKVVIPLMTERARAIEEESAKVLSLANETFKERGGWNSSIIDINVDMVEEEDGCIYRCEATAVVRVQLVSQREKFHEDVGCGITENTFKPYAVENAKKEAVKDARTRALKLLIADKDFATPTKVPDSSQCKKKTDLPLLSPIEPSKTPAAAVHVESGSTSNDSGGNSGCSNDNNIANSSNNSKESSGSGSNGNGNDDDDDDTFFLANFSDEILTNSPVCPKEDPTKFCDGNKQNVERPRIQQQVQQIQVQKPSDAPTQPPKRPFHPVVVSNPPKRMK